jgi:hypothetical protein
MKTARRNNRCRCGFDSLAQMALLAGLFWAQNICAMPRSPLPPYPEQAPLYYEGFDEEYFAGQTNSELLIAGLGTLEESWSGYALQRVGDVIPFVIPAVDSTGHTNVSCDTAGALRFWISPYWTSSSVASGASPGTTATVLELDAVNGTQSAVAWSLQISADGNTVSLSSQTGAGLQMVLQAPIAWQAGTWHNVVLDFGPQGSALFVDGMLSAQASSLPSIPPSVGQLVIGSALAGNAAAGADFDEIYSFNHDLTDSDIASYWQMTSGEAALGPLPDVAQGQQIPHRRPLQSPADLTPVYDPNQGGGCVTVGPVFITNFFSVLTNRTTTVYFDVQGGTNGILYDIYSGYGLSTHQWNWLCQGFTCSSYSFSNQPADFSFYVVAAPTQTLAVEFGITGGGMPAGLSNSVATAAGCASQFLDGLSWRL